MLFLLLLLLIEPMSFGGVFKSCQIYLVLKLPLERPVQELPDFCQCSPEGHFPEVCSTHPSEHPSEKVPAREPTAAEQ